MLIINDQIGKKKWLSSRELLLTLRWSQWTVLIWRITTIHYLKFRVSATILITVRARYTHSTYPDIQVKYLLSLMNSKHVQQGGRKSCACSSESLSSPWVRSAASVGCPIMVLTTLLYYCSCVSSIEFQELCPVLSSSAQG